MTKNDGISHGSGSSDKVSHFSFSLVLSLQGVFLFMGLSSMPGIQFWNRFLLFFQQPSKFAEKPFTKYMSTTRIHLFTVFQIVFFLGVFFVQNTPSIAIAFPFMTLLCIPARLFLAPVFFEGWELCLLDGYDEDIEEWLAAKEANDRGEVAHAAESSDDGEVPVEPMDAGEENV